VTRAALPGQLPRLPAKEVRRLADLCTPAGVVSEAARRGVSCTEREAHIESEAAKRHFALGCWLAYLRDRIEVPGERGREARLECALRIFCEGIPNPGYQFYTLFGFGERDFDTIFEMGDADAIVRDLWRAAEGEQVLGRVWRPAEGAPPLAATLREAGVRSAQQMNETSPDGDEPEGMKP